MVSRLSTPGLKAQLILGSHDDGCCLLASATVDIGRPLPRP
jgi:hypothetical protein